MTMSRREFLWSIPAGAALARSSSPASAASLEAGTHWLPPQAGRPAIRVGCQTNAWPLKPGDFDQFIGVLGVLKSLGFDGFETSFRNVQSQYAAAAEARARIEKTGVACFGIHIFLNEYDPATRIAPMDFVRTTADGAAALGAQRLILSGAGLVKDGKVAEADLAQKIGGLNAAARYCKDKGLAFAYHNHGPEFAANGTEIEALIGRTDPALVAFLIDCGHAVRAGVDLAAFFTKHHRRICGMHLRDFKGGVEPQVPLGQGDVDWKPLAAAVKKAGWTGWVLAEEERVDGSKPGESAARPARETLRALFGV
jgi:inosose dehydratase